MTTRNIDHSFLDSMPANVAVQFLDRVEKSGPREAFRFPVDGGARWDSITWQEAGEVVTAWAAGLMELGIQPEQRVGIACTTRYEWCLADLAVMCAGAATTTVYPTTNEEDTAYILADSECHVVFAEDDEQIAKLRARRSELPHVAKVVTFDGTTDGDWIISTDELAELGRAHLAKEPSSVVDHAQAIRPDQLATLMYTSGTTGRPKGVRLSHRAWVFEGEAIRAQGILSEDDLEFRWLPLSHSFGKVLMATQMACGYSCAIDGTIEKIIDNLAVVKPTFMGAAPRIFEKAYSKIVMMQEAEGGIKEKLFNAAFSAGLEARALEKQGKKVPALLNFKRNLFDKIVFSKIRARFGGRVRFFISGSAALNSEIAQWFDAANITILEGYGLTETAAGSFVNLPWDNRIGTVGPAFPGNEVRIGENDEVQMRGPSIMEGYHNLPEETAAAFTSDGWFRTGDKGSLDADGYLAITGRIKELFKTSGGKYIAPPMIEAKFKAISPYASQFLVFGNERNYCVALITLDPDALAGWAAENGKADLSYTELVNSPEVKALVSGHVEELNKGLNRWETIKKWRLLDHDLTIESGELTPSMKVKRNVVEANNAALIDGMYQE